VLPSVEEEAKADPQNPEITEMHKGTPERPPSAKPRKHIIIWAVVSGVAAIIVAVVILITRGGNDEPPLEDIAVNLAAINLTASAGSAAIGFGRYLAIDGDTIIVSSSLTFGKNDTAHVYAYSENVWTEQAILTDGGIIASVGINEDTVAIGYPYGGGSVLVYTRSGNVWTLQATLTAGVSSKANQFGNSVAMDGDTLVIGASVDDNGDGIDSGSAYVYTQSGTGWTEQAKLTASDGAASDYFGTSVAIDGDTIVVGAWDRKSVGGAYVHARSAAGWTEQAKLMPSGGAVVSTFGWSVALDGDTVVVGTNAGEGAYVFTRSGTIWNGQAHLTVDVDGDHGFGDHGFSVAIDGDTIVVGTRFGESAAYVYTRSGTIWTENVKLSAKIDGAMPVSFGRIVAIDGDNIVVNADSADSVNRKRSGIVYIFKVLGCALPCATPKR